MDKKNTIIGLLLLVVAFAWMNWEQTQLEKKQVQYEKERQLYEKNQARQVSTNESLPIPQELLDSTTFNPIKSSKRIALKADIIVPEKEKTYLLETDFLRVTFTNLGGAIKKVDFKKYPLKVDSLQPYPFNQGSSLPALSLSLGEDPISAGSLLTPFSLDKKTTHMIQFVQQITPELKLYRSYQLAKNTSQKEDYLIKGNIRWENTSENTLTLNKLFINLGTIPPEKADLRGEFMNFGYHNGLEFESINLKEFIGSSGFLGIGAHPPIPYVTQPAMAQWGSIKNQFFTAVLSPEKSASEIFSRAIEIDSLQGIKTKVKGLTGSLGFIQDPLLPRSSKNLAFDYYVGPKEYNRLQSLGNQQDQVMQFGFFGWASKPLLKLLNFFYGISHNWGIAIILLTILIKTLFWPLTSKGIRSQKITGKKMSFLQEPMKKIREKHKGDNAKIQSEMMALYSREKVNPAGAVLGCLPLLIQMPIFFGLFVMLRTASELRFAEFLWVSDLSQPDQLFFIGGFPINALPLIMTLTTYLQMRMTPMPQNGDEQQLMIQKMMRFMPFIFLFMLYGFASGLALYWTSNNVLTILQTYFINRRVQPELDKIDAEQAEKKKKADRKLEKEQGRNKKKRR